jgi:hypothetical protein
MSPDGTLVVAGSLERNVVHFWDAATEDQVNSWNREEAAARELNHDAFELLGALRDWLVLGPIPLNKGQDAVQGLSYPFLQGEESLQPMPGDVVTVGVEKFTWRGKHAKTNMLSLSPKNNQVHYAVCNIKSDKEKKGLRLLVKSDDQSRIFLNGQLVYEFPEDRGPHASEDEIEVDLKQGANSLVFKIVNGRELCSGSVRLLDHNYQRVSGVVVSATQ